MVHATDYQPIVSQLYRLELDNILWCYVLYHERTDILWECHNGVAGGHIGGNDTAGKILQLGLQWPTVLLGICLGLQCMPESGKPISS
jgi:hypothetical protein